MESVLYSNGSDLHISNVRISAANKVLAVHNVASVESNRVKGKSPLAGYATAAGGVFLMIGAIAAGSPGGAAFCLMLAMVGGVMILLRQPRFQVLAVTNAGERVSLFCGKRQDADRVAAAASEAIVSVHAGYGGNQAAPAPEWVRA